MCIRDRLGLPSFLRYGSEYAYDSLAGTGDRTCPASTAAEIKARYVPQAEVVLIRKGRHCVYTEFVGETANAIVGFLRRQEGRE